MRDTETNIRCDPELFSKYVSPKSDINWCQATQKNMLYPQHPLIMCADGIVTSWRQFAGWDERKIDEDETAILVAWNGESCDLKWLWRLTQALDLALSMPYKIEFLLDPEIVIRKRASCKLHKSHSKVLGTQLTTAWTFIHSLSVTPKEKASHNSVVDVQAQTDSVLDQRFVPWIDREVSI